MEQKLRFLKKNVLKLLIVYLLSYIVSNLNQIYYGNLRESTEYNAPDVLNEPVSGEAKESCY